MDEDCDGSGSAIPAGPAVAPAGEKVAFKRKKARSGARPKRHSDVGDGGIGTAAR